MLTRLVLFAISVFMASTRTVSQESNLPDMAISRMIDSGVFDSQDEKIIAGKGDAAAVMVTKVLRGRTLDPGQIDRTLLVLNTAFGGVVPGPDAEPKTALFVFRELELSTNDAQLRARIGQSRKYAEEEFSKSTKTAAQD